MAAHSTPKKKTLEPTPFCMQTTAEQPVRPQEERGEAARQGRPPTQLLQGAAPVLQASWSKSSKDK